MVGYIYKCTFNDKIYIGESINATNPHYLGKGKLWLETINGHEKEVQKEIIETISHSNRKTLKQLMHQREIYWINYYDSTNPNKGYNISPGGNLMAESSLIKMKQKDAETIKKLMASTDIPKKISKSLSEYRQKNGFSKEHLQKISAALKGRNVGCNGDSRSIGVYCIINKHIYEFHNKIQAAKWWYENYPISENYTEITYTRLINKSISNIPLTYNKKKIDLDIHWFLSFNKEDPVYCIVNDTTKYKFKNKNQAACWWHYSYKYTMDFSILYYVNCITKSINSKKSIIYPYNDNTKIQWFRKE